MKKYHVATGDGKAYYGVNYKSYREAEAVLRFSQKHDPQAHIVEEEYHFTNADRIRAMSDEELAKECVKQFPMYLWPTEVRTIYFDFEKPNKNNAVNAWLEWLKQPADKGE